MQYYDIKDVSQYSLKSLNDQLRTLFNKVYGDIGTKDIAAGGVNTVNIKDNAIDSIKIGEAAIKTANIEDAAIASAKIGFAVITNAHISSLEADRLKADKIDVVSLGANEALITNLTVNQALIDFLTSNYAHIKDGFIDNAVVGTTQIANGSITNAKIVDLVANKINAGTLSVERLIIRGETTSIIYAINNITGALQSENVDTINGEVLTERTITADKIVAHEITANEIAAHTLTANEILAGTITAASGIINDIDATTIKTGKLTGGAVEFNLATGTLKITHTDGSYSLLDSNGLNRYVSSTVKRYYYLNYLGYFRVETGVGTSTVITLPDEFKGKDFTVSISAKNVAPYVTALSYFTMYLESTDIVNGTFTVHTGFQGINYFWNSTYSRVDCSYQDQGLIDVSYVVLA